MQAEQSSSTLIDPALVSVLGVAKDGESRSSEEAGSTPVGAKVKKIAVSSEEASSSPAKPKKSRQSPGDGVVKDKGKKKLSPQARSTRPTTDSKLEAKDLKWSERFSRLEASKTLSQIEPSFQQLKITPGIHSTEPFFEPAPLTNRPKFPLQQTSDRPLSSQQPLATDQALTNPLCQQKVGTSGSEPSQQPSDSDMNTDSASDSGSVIHVAGQEEEGCQNCQHLV